MELSMIKVELIDQYKKCIDGINAYSREIEDNCVRGYISSKTINGKVYHYLQWNDGKKLCSKYIKRNHLEIISENIQQRKDYEERIKSMKRSAKEIEQFVGKENIKKYLSEV